jgi:hypothetical protein
VLSVPAELLDRDVADPRVRAQGSCRQWCACMRVLGGHDSFVGGHCVLLKSR